MKSHLTHCGIPGVGAVPFGLHVCHFYATRNELLELLIPYFQAGLKNNERCLWIASEPLTAADICAELPKHSDLQEGLTLGHLSIFDAADWYRASATLEPDGIVQRWLDEEERALAKGYEGLRITGNTSFVPRSDWHRLMEYERQLHSGMRDRRIVACCSYNRLQCGAVEILDVAQVHNAALDRRGESWQVLTKTVGSSLNVYSAAAS